MTSLLLRGELRNLENSLDFLKMARAGFEFDIPDVRRKRKHFLGENCPECTKLLSL